MSEKITETVLKVLFKNKKRTFEKKFKSFNSYPKILISLNALMVTRFDIEQRFVAEYLFML